MARDTLLVYGAYGFTGRLVLENLKARGIGFVVAGRDERRVAQVASELGSPHRVFALDDSRRLDRALSGIGVLLNAAGPFLRTTAPLLGACLRRGIHYLDLSGEVRPLEHAASLDADARKRKVMILPGVGFDVVPSDCLAVHLAHRMPGAQALTLSISGSNLLSRGSAFTFAEHAGIPVYVRKSGLLEPMLFRTQMRWVDFGFDIRPAIAVSWGDLVTAFRSTGIPDIEVYFEATTPRWMGISGNQYFGWMFRQPWMRSWLKAYASSVPEGPTSDARRRERVVIVGEASRSGRRVRARLTTPEAYTFTGTAAAAIVERVLGGLVAHGFQTPGALLGADFVLSLDGVCREDLS
ncbi:MAG TPA: saccharopine dehydrogenase NADP-binding domain-containing protein [Polyangiaceae bacterium]|nr:saccharopine dehydrogenase NADP-binding domain-containing protein [Polyangiaceae bacterium]